jgi:hypothetical protein
LANGLPCATEQLAEPAETDSASIATPLAIERSMTVFDL